MSFPLRGGAVAPALFRPAAHRLLVCARSGRRAAPSWSSQAGPAGAAWSVSCRPLPGAALYGARKHCSRGAGKHVPRLDSAATPLPARLGQHGRDPGSGQPSPVVAPDARASGNPLQSRLYGVYFGSAALFDLRYGAEVEIDAGDIASYYLVRATLAGSGMVELGRRSAAIRAGSLTVSSPSERSLIRVGSDCRSLILRVERPALERRLQQLLERPLRGAAGVRRGRGRRFVGHGGGAPDAGLSVPAAPGPRHRPAGAGAGGGLPGLPDVIAADAAAA